MAVASLILGIISLMIVLITFVPGVGVIGSIIGVIAIILGAIGRNRSENKGLATGGFVCGIIALCYGIISTIMCAGLLASGY